MLLKERKCSRIESSVRSPHCAPWVAVIFFSLMRNSEIVKFAAKRFVCIHMILIAVESCPVECQASQRTKVGSGFDQRFFEMKAHFGFYNILRIRPWFTLCIGFVHKVGIKWRSVEVGKKRLANRDEISLALPTSSNDFGGESFFQSSESKNHGRIAVTCCNGMKGVRNAKCFCMAHHHF